MGHKSGYKGVRARSKSSIEISFMFEGVRHREIIKLKPTAVNLAKAAEHRAAILSAIDFGTFDYAITFPNSRPAREAEEPPVTLQTYLEEWLDNMEPYLKQSTHC